MTQRQTSLVLPVPELDSAVPGAHIALLTPFLEQEAVDAGVLAELRDFFAALTPFPYVLGDPVELPDGGRYLPPQPVAVLRRIGHSLRHTFPEVVGPVARLGTPGPHLALPDGVEVPTPLEVHAREAVLVAGGTPLATFPFGTSAA